VENIQNMNIKTCGVSKYISSTAGCEKYKDSADGKPSSQYQ
jgi:hypothetical protein